MAIRPQKWIVHRTNGDIEAVEEYTYLPSHEREEIEPAYSDSDMMTILDRIENALLEGGNAEAFDEIEQIEDEIRETAGLS